TTASCAAPSSRSPSTIPPRRCASLSATWHNPPPRKDTTMALGTKSKRGIYRFGEDDSQSSFSELLNLGMDSVHDAIRAFSGTPAERALLTQADVALGSTWTDTDSAARIWRMTATGWAEIRPGRHYSGTAAERAAFAA